MIIGGRIRGFVVADVVMKKEVRSLVRWRRSEVEKADGKRSH